MEENQAGFGLSPQGRGSFRNQQFDQNLNSSESIEQAIQSLNENAKQIQSMVQDPVSYNSFVAALEPIQTLINYNISDFQSGIGAPRSQFIQHLNAHLQNKRNQMLGLGDPSKFPGEGHNLPQFDESSTFPQQNFHASQNYNQMSSGDLLAARFQQRDAQTRKHFDDFTLNGDIRISDIPDLIPQFGRVLGLQITSATSNPEAAMSHLKEYLATNSGNAELNHDDLMNQAEYINYDNFIELFVNFVNTSNEINVQPDFSEGIQQQQHPIEDDDNYRQNLIDTIRNFENSTAQTPQEKAKIQDFLTVLKKKLNDHDRERGLRNTNDSTGANRGQVARQGQKQATKFGSKLPFSQLNPDQKQQFCLKEIFGFYSKQVIMTGKHATFDDISKEMNILHMGEFLRFCLDFEFKLSKAKLTEIFKKSSYTSREITLDEFIKMLGLLMKQANIYETSELKKKLRETQKRQIQQKKIEQKKAKDGLLSEKEQKRAPSQSSQNRGESALSKAGSRLNLRPEDEQQKQGENQSQHLSPKAAGGALLSSNKSQSKIPFGGYSSSHIVPKKNLTPNYANVDFESEKANIKARLAQLEDQPARDYFNQALAKIGIPHLGIYRSKMKNFTLPFGIRDKEQRIGAEDRSKNYKFKSKRNPDQIHKEIQRLKDERQKRKKDKEHDKKEKYEASRRALKKIQSKMMKQRQEEIKKGHPSTYTGLQNKKMGLPPDQKHQKLTWKVLQDLSYTDINQDTSDDFKPSDVLLQESDEELDEELARLGVSRNNQGGVSSVQNLRDYIGGQNNTNDPQYDIQSLQGNQNNYSQGYQQYMQQPQHGNAGKYNKKKENQRGIIVASAKAAAASANAVLKGINQKRNQQDQQQQLLLLQQQQQYQQQQQQKGIVRHNSVPKGQQFQHQQGYGQNIPNVKTVQRSSIPPHLRGSNTGPNKGKKLPTESLRYLPKHQDINAGGPQHRSLIQGPHRGLISPQRQGPLPKVGDAPHNIAASYGNLQGVRKGSEGRKVGNEYYQRANQIDAQSKLKEEMRMNRALQMHEQNVKKGMLAANRQQQQQQYQPPQNQRRY